MKIEIELPKGFMNTAVTSDNFFIADTNNSANWDKLKFPLPRGKWSIHSTSNKKVVLQKSRVNLLFIFSVVLSFFAGGNCNKMNFEKMKVWRGLKVTIGYDENIKFFFRASKLHGLEIAFFNRLLSVGK
jgi:hypothetical protein